MRSSGDSRHNCMSSHTAHFVILTNSCTICRSHSCSMYSSHTLRAGSQSERLSSADWDMTSADFSPFLFPPPSFPLFIVFVFYLQHAFGPAIHPKKKTSSFSLLLTSLYFPPFSEKRFFSHTLIGLSGTLVAYNVTFYNI